MTGLFCCFKFLWAANALYRDYPATFDWNGPFIWNDYICLKPEILFMGKKTVIISYSYFEKYQQCLEVVYPSDICLSSCVYCQNFEKGAKKCIPKPIAHKFMEKSKKKGGI